MRRRPIARSARLALTVVVASLATSLAFVPAGPAEAGAGPGFVQQVDPALTTSLQPVTPCRLFDSRETPNLGRLDAQTWRIQVTERCDVPAGARAAALIITATDPVAQGFVTVSPAGGPRPLASNLNVDRGNTVANSAVVQLPASGAVDVFTQSPVDVVIDVTSVFVAAPTATAGRFVPLPPSRLLDTRETGERGSTELRIPLPDGVPADATALAVTVTVVDAESDGYLTVYPAGGSPPLASVVNADALNRIRANAVFAPVSSDGLAVFRFMPTDVVVDVWGWFTGPSAAQATDGLFVPQAPTRVWDSRESFDPLHAGGTLERVLVPAGAAAMVANVTAVDMTRPGYFSIWPAGTPRPVVSSLNHRWPQPAGALAIARTSDRGVAFFAFGGGAHVVVDLAGWFTGAPEVATLPPGTNVPPPAATPVIMVSDSAFAGIRWNGALRYLTGAVFDARLESCRRVIGVSCRGREGYAPPNAIQEIESLPVGRYTTAIIATGYNDFASLFPIGVDQLIRTARAKGIERVIWMTHREDVTYRSPGGASFTEVFRSHNRALRNAVASGLYPELLLADWKTYTTNRSWWLTADGVHLTSSGARAAAEYTSRLLAAIERRPCPAVVGGVTTPGGWCAHPDVTGPP
ncbi:MAG TPA: hypothetical protein VK853_03655 [Ilumatobacteraceae bacterium]|nr:hypothetical protein [Ilumatobacteraceae bacterium]